MCIKSFITNFSEAIDYESNSILVLETNFRELDSWDSLAALSVMAMIDDKYSVNLSADEMRSANTLRDLFALIEIKLK